MDYKEKYEQALERARQFSEKPYLEDSAGIVEYIFPELKESEGERIRKEILDCFRAMKQQGCFPSKHKEQYDSWIAWLEKQVPVDEDEVVKGIRRGVAISLINHIDANSKGMCLSNMECEDIENAIVNEDWDKVYGYMKKKLEKQGEQKPDTDFSNIRIWKYIVDAVLTEKEGIGQYLDSSFTEEVAKKLQKRFGNIEQKPTFEMKTPEESLGIDSDTYNKIVDECVYGEQISANETPYPETLEEAIDLYYNSYGNGEGEFEHLSLEKFRDIVHTFVSDYGQKPAWSEEELDSITAAINNLEYLKNNYVYHQMGLEPAITFLKSLKDRVQPKQEWSEEDNMMLQYAIEHFERQKRNCIESGVRKKVMQEFIDWLKSLRPQNRWKPSDEQMEALRYVTNFDYGGHKATLVSLYEQLKKLREE